MRRPWTYMHTACLRQDSEFPARPGGFAVVVQQPLAIRLTAEQEDPLLLNAGHTLFLRREANLQQAFRNHLFGTVYDSDLRLGVALVIRFSGCGTGEAWTELERERRVDEWLDRYTAIAIGRLPPSMMRADVNAPLNQIPEVPEFSLRADREQ